MFADAACLGREIDLTLAGEPRSHQLHTMIRRRRTVNSDVVAGVYAEVPAGTYTVWGLDDTPLGDITITGGHVSEFRGDRCGLPQLAVAADS